MNETQYINDDFGNKIPLLDPSGNLSLQVIMLYTEDKLTSADRKIVEDFAATDEFTKDALEGYALTSNASKTRFAVGELNSSIQKRSGAKAVSTLTPQKTSDFDFRKLAAAIALLIVIGGGTFFISQYLKDDNLAINEEQKSEVPTDRKSNTTETRSATAASNSDTIVDSEMETGGNQHDLPPLELMKDAKKEQTETKVSERPVSKFDLNEQAKALEEEEENTPPKEEEVLEVADLATETTTGNSSRASDKLDDEANTSDADQLAGNSYGIVDEVVEEKAEEVVVEREAALASAQSRLAEEQAARKELERNEVAKAKRSQVELNQMDQASMSEMTAAEEDAKPADRSAQFPGGDIKMYKFIERKKNYTQAMQSQGMKGAVTVTFDIEADGRVTNARIKSGVTGLLDEDALRIIRSMPNWKPALRGGSEIRTSKSVVVKYGD